MSIKKSFVINNNLANLTKSHLVQLFKPTYNPKKDDPKWAIENSTPVTNHFALQEYDQTITGSNSNSVICEYCNNPGTTDAKNIVTNLFLVTENFISFINKINNIWYGDTTPRVITPITYNVAAGTGVITAVADTSFRATLLPFFSGPSANNASQGLAAYEDLAEVGIEGHNSIDGVGSCSVHELFLRHLYSLDVRKRNIAFNFAQSFYGISATEINAAKLEMIPAEDFDSDLFSVDMTDDIIKFDYSKPIKLQTKFIETTHNVGNKDLYLYFPYITSNAMRANVDKNGDYRNFIHMYTGLVTANNTTAFPGAGDRISDFNQTMTSRPFALNGLGALSKPNENMATLTNSIWSVVKNKSVNQAGYTALKISEVGGGGDIQFDHTDKIDYIDSITIEIKVPTVFS